MPRTAQRTADPGRLPTRPTPKRGQKVLIRVAGYPPFKQIRASLRNPKHPHYDRFVKLRKAATKAMHGRKWSEGAVALNFTMLAPGFEKGKTLVDYEAGILDTLDGSHGFQFTYLPVIFQDDCQVCSSDSRFRANRCVSYIVEVEFLE